MVSPRWLRRRPLWQRLLAAGVSATLVAVGAAMAIGGTDDRNDTHDVAVAAVALAATADVQPELDPLAGITVTQAQVHVTGTDQASLPVPELAPLDPHAPTPEVRYGRLEIPSIGLDQPFFEGVTLTAINRGPSHWPGTAMPGEIGNVVIAGHRTTYTRPFWDLQAVQPGDELIFTMEDGTRYVYVHDDTEIVDPEDTHIVDQTPARTATLFGCHPRGSARHRIVAHFHLQPVTTTVEVVDTDQIRAPQDS